MHTPKKKTVDEIIAEFRKEKEELKKSQDRMLKYSDNHLKEKNIKNTLLEK